MLGRIRKLKMLAIMMGLAFFSITTLPVHAAETQMSFPLNAPFVLGMSYYSDQYLNALASANNVGIGTPITTWPTIDDSTQTFMFIAPSQANNRIQLICTANRNVCVSKSNSGYAELDSISPSRAVEFAEQIRNVRYTSGSDVRYLTRYQALPTGYYNSYYCLFTEASYVDNYNQAWLFGG